MIVGWYYPLITFLATPPFLNAALAPAAAPFLKPALPAAKNFLPPFAPPAAANPFLNFLPPFLPVEIYFAKKNKLKGC